MGYLADSVTKSSDAFFESKTRLMNLLETLPISDSQKEELESQIDETLEAAMLKADCQRSFDLL